MRLRTFWTGWIDRQRSILVCIPLACVRTHARRVYGYAKSPIKSLILAIQLCGQVVTPIFHVLEKTISLRAQPGKGYSSAIADRAMYDDINEFFWQATRPGTLIT